MSEGCAGLRGAGGGGHGGPRHGECPGGRYSEGRAPEGGRNRATKGGYGAGKTSGMWDEGTRCGYRGTVSRVG